MRPITVPPASPREISAMIAFEAEKYLPFPAAGACLAWSPQDACAGTGAEPFNIVLVAIKKEAVEAVLKEQAHKGILVEAVVPRTFAWQDSIRKDPSLAQSDVLFVWTDEKGWEIDIFAKGAIAVTRGQLFTSEQHEGRRQELADEVTKTQRLYQRPLAHMIVPEAFKDMPLDIGRATIVAGLSDATVADAVSINGPLIPEPVLAHYRRVNRMRAFAKYALPVAGGLAGLSLLAAIFNYTAINSAYHAFKNRRANALLQAQSLRDQALRRENESFMSSALVPLRVLTALQSAVPASACVTNLEYDAPHNQISLRGRTLSYTTVTAFAGTLIKTPFFKDVQNKGARKTRIDDRDVIDCEFSLRAAPYAIQIGTGNVTRGDTSNKYWKKTEQEQSLAFQSYVQDTARAAGITDVTALRPQERTIVWEGRATLSSLIQFISLLSSGSLPCRVVQMHLTPDETRQELVKASLTVEQSWAPGKAPVFTGGFIENPVQRQYRNIFKPLWQSPQTVSATQSAPAKPAPPTRQELEEKALAYAREETLRLQQEEQERQARRKQLEADLKVTGIVNDGSRLVAFIQNRRDGNRTVTAGQGDTIEGCAITAINEKTGKVFLKNEQFALELNLQ